MRRPRSVFCFYLLTHTSGFRLDVLFLSPLLEQSAEHPDAPGLQTEVLRFTETGPEVESGQASGGRVGAPGIPPISHLSEPRAV